MKTLSKKQWIVIAALSVVFVVAAFSIFFNNAYAEIQNPMVSSDRTANGDLILHCQSNGGWDTKGWEAKCKIPQFDSEGHYLSDKEETYKDSSGNANVDITLPGNCVSITVKEIRHAVTDTDELTAAPNQNDTHTNYVYSINVVESGTLFNGWGDLYAKAIDGQDIHTHWD